jgi:hypothetical protein
MLTGLFNTWVTKYLGDEILGYQNTWVSKHVGNKLPTLRAVLVRKCLLKRDHFSIGGSDVILWKIAGCKYTRILLRIFWGFIHQGNASGQAGEDLVANGTCGGGDLVDIEILTPEFHWIAYFDFSHFGEVNTYRIH